MKKGILLASMVLLLILSVACSKERQEPQDMEQPTDVAKQEEVKVVEPPKEEVTPEKEQVKPEGDKEEKDKDQEVDEKEEDQLEETVVEPTKPKEDEMELPVLPDPVEEEKVSTDGLSNELIRWSWRRNQEHARPEAYVDAKLLEKYDAYYLAPSDDKVIYLTFDNGYENGFTPMILDALKRQDVKATFFVTLPYIRDNKDLVIRMKEEGHIVGNHTVKHKSMPSESDEEVVREIRDVEEFMLETTGYSIDPYFRPPMGEFSERTLSITQSLGYKSIFWSMAYVDWKTDEQPGKEYALNHVLENYHPGSIPLLHSVSSSNAEALEDMIIQLKEKGYSFGALSELE